MNKQILVALVACVALSACIADSTASRAEPETVTDHSTIGTSTGDDGSSFSDRAVLDIEMPEFLDLVLIYETRIDPGWGAVIKERPIMRFDDGLFTRDLRGVLANGIAGSQRESPELWGEWQGDPTNDSLELKEGGYSEFAALIAGNQVDSIPADLVLDQCYTAQSSTYSPSPELGEYSNTLRFDTFCFQSNGVFTNEVSSSVLTPEMVGASSRDDAGLYEIDGHIVRLTYGNGDVVYDLFGVYSTSDKPQFSITMGSTVFRRADDG